ncbi:MAG TPA: hypothetical protein VN519_03510 [Bryobacteraceae bacterium]|nr:hypothetical protein [Bryobacteraceae bacterium]
MKKGFITVAGAIIASAALYGQAGSGGPVTFQFATASGPKQVFSYSTLGGPVVTGRPFSATEERKSSQTLGDGTHIETTETNRLFRDEQGRTRQERKDGGISIYDPVAGFSAQLDPSTRTATKRMVMVRLAPPTPDTKQRLEILQKRLAEAERLTSDKSPQAKDIQNQIADLKKIAVEQGIITSVGAATSEAVEPQFRPRAEAGHVELRTNNAEERGGGGAFIYTTALAEGPTILRVDSGNNGNVESLPPQMVNGVLAQGTRSTETIPVGKIGNDRAISVVSERWYSNDLQMLVKSTSSDPRFGDSTYQLTNIVQTSPDPSLFQIPGDYTIRK